MAGATSQEATASKGRGQSAPGFKKWSPTRPLISHCTAMSSAKRKGKQDGRAPRELGEDTRDSGPAPPAQGACGSAAFAGLESDAMALEGKQSGQVLAVSVIESTLYLRALACVAIPTSLL